MSLPGEPRGHVEPGQSGPDDQHVGTVRAPGPRTDGGRGGGHGGRDGWGHRALQGMARGTGTGRGQGAPEAPHSTRTPIE
ncbi:hypothetical protein RKD39_006513 [Streptomyces albogriseolus]